VSVATVARERQRYFEEGLEVALMSKKPGLARRRVLNGRAEAHLIALSCSDPPKGRDRWSWRLLADRMVELGYAEPVSYETVRRTLKNRLKPPLKRQWVIPPRKSAAKLLHRPAWKFMGWQAMPAAGRGEEFFPSRPGDLSASIRGTNAKV
jgi:hypothetical protein